MPTKADEELNVLLANPTTSDLLQKIIPIIMLYDPIEAALEIDRLADALERRMDALTATAQDEIEEDQVRGYSMQEAYDHENPAPLERPHWESEQ